jgi:response regulator RpfG family c-di-GMP phosphodiesterase
MVSPPDPTLRVLVVSDSPQFEDFVSRLAESKSGDVELDHLIDQSRLSAIVSTFNPSVVLFLLKRNESLVSLSPRFIETLGLIPFLVGGVPVDPSVRKKIYDLGAGDCFDELPESVEFLACLKRHSRRFLALRDRDVNSSRTLQVSQQLRARNTELQELNSMFRQSVDALRDKVDLQGTRLDTIGKVGVELSEIQDLNILMDHILSEARRLVHAESGAILTRDHEDLVVRYRQNEALNKEGRSIGSIAGGLRIPLSANSISGRVSLTGEYINVEDVYQIPENAGFRFLTSFDERTGYRTRAMLVYPLSTPTGDPLGVLQLANPSTPSGEPKARFDNDDIKMIRNFASMASLALERANLTRSLIMRMIAMAETHDPEETGAHVNRVAGYSRILFEAWANRRGIGRIEMARQRDRLSIAAMLHDVGKIGIPDSILKKPSALEPDEYKIMQRHTLIGAFLCQGTGVQTEFDEVSQIVALHHHERWDGSGYPGPVDETLWQNRSSEMPDQHGLRGEDIPIEARIVGLADVFDALSSSRSYKEPWPEERVLEEIQSLSEKHFDPELVEIFFSEIDRIRAVQLAFSGQP